MKIGSGEGKCPAVKVAAVLLCIFMLTGFIRVPAFAAEAEETENLVDLYCSQTVKDMIGQEKLQELTEIVVTSIEPQAVNLLIEKFPCFQEAADNDEIGREIGLYIYYRKGDADGIDEHQDLPSDAYAYADAWPIYD